MAQYRTIHGLSEDAVDDDHDILRNTPADFPRRVAESFVDQQIDRFVKDLNARLKQLTDGLEAADRCRVEALGADPGSAPSSEKRWKEALSQCSDSAASIFKMISDVVPLMGVKDDFRPRVRRERGASFLEKETALLRDTVAKIRQGVDDLILKPTHVVDLKELHGENVLVHLRRGDLLCRAMMGVL